jgi:hypothetical protein
MLLLRDLSLASDASGMGAFRPPAKSELRIANRELVANGERRIAIEKLLALEAAERVDPCGVGRIQGGRGPPCGPEPSGGGPWATGDKSAPLPRATLFKPLRGSDVDPGIQESEPQIQNDGLFIENAEIQKIECRLQLEDSKRRSVSKFQSKMSSF